MQKKLLPEILFFSVHCCVDFCSFYGKWQRILLEVEMITKPFMLYYRSIYINYTKQKQRRKKTFFGWMHNPAVDYIEPYGL